MDAPELKKQFRVSVFDHCIVIDAVSNRIDGIEYQHNGDITINKLPCIESAYGVCNYYECCGVLLLFGIQPPTFEEVVKQLKLNQ